MSCHTAFSWMEGSGVPSGSCCQEPRHLLGTPIPARRGPRRPSQSQYLATCSGAALPRRPSSSEHPFCPDSVCSRPSPWGPRLREQVSSPTSVPLRSCSRATPQPYAIFVPVSWVGTAVLAPLFPGSWAGKCSSCSSPPHFSPDSLVSGVKLREVRPLA